ncbi:uncharacterized protein LOC132713702 [Ruditapes philippinarum]|uniref:uncharacterized protein LOC132713702 n=1 Tax=Ruditapes philippinarum TaxID=129788 RepID=UPI00295B6106|nr:uncharacterized protein LOC132713702 [Ruditapes philippinarum]
MAVSWLVYILISGLFKYTRAEPEQLPFRLAHTLHGVVIINSFHSVSLRQCQELCQARERCVAIKIDRLFGLCHLCSSDSSTDGVQVVSKARTVYSEKANWSKKTLDDRCSQCSEVETCIVNNDIVTCHVLECDEPETPDENSKVLGTQRNVGAKIVRKCNDFPLKSRTSTCQENGYWSNQTLECLPAVNLEGKTFMIYAKANNQFWHFDGGHPNLKVVSSIWQPNDNFVRFTFEKQTDGSYKIKSVAMPLYMYDGFNVPGAKGIYLNGDDQIDDDHMRYFVTMETPEYYRIKTKATNRYVRLDTDKYVSSINNVADDRSLFKLVEV